MAVRLAPTKTDKPLGRGTRLGIPFKWRGPAGDFIDLTGYTAQVWVSTHDGGITVGSPAVATVAGTEATYHMTADDLAVASANATDFIYFTAVATSGDGATVLPPNKRAINVADWTGADDMLGVVV
jgi:hypothetical protein